jgi:hypothetical protein
LLPVYTTSTLLGSPSSCFDRSYATRLSVKFYAIVIPICIGARVYITIPFKVIITLREELYLDMQQLHEVYLRNIDKHHTY